MLKFIAWRLVQFPLMLAAVYLITFLLAWVVPGSPFERTDRKLDPRVAQAMQEKLHAQSAWTFLRWYPWNLVTKGDFGPSLNYEEWSVNDILKTALPVSVTIGLFGLTFAVMGGVGLGTLAAVRRGSLLDWLSLSVAVIGISLPGFVSAALLLMGFAVKWPIFSIGGWGRFSDLVLPGIAAGLMPMAYIARLTRVSMIDVLSSDYIRTARAKGLSRLQVIGHHALRNALLPVLSYLGPAAAGTLTGSFVVEQVFNLPGLGQHFVNSVRNRDQTLILGTVMIYSAILLTMNLLVDIAYAWVDPRIEVGKKGQ
jgi:oligopeptide transport system permease protein